MSESSDVVAPPESTAPSFECPPGFDPAFLCAEEAALLKGTTPGVPLDEYLKRSSGHSRWVVEGLVPAGGTCAIYGPPKRARKSFFAIQMVQALAEGKPFLDQFNIPEAGTTVVFQLDTPQSLWQERHEKLEVAGVPFPPEVKARIVTVDATDIFPLDIGSAKGQAYVRYHIRKYQPVLVIFDVMRKIYKGSEDATDTTEQALADMKRACMPAAVIFITHAKKPKETGDTGTMNELRGSSHIGGSCDTVMRIRPATKKRKHALLCVEGRAVPTVDYPMKSLDNHFYALVTDDWSKAIEKFAKAVENEEYKNVSVAAVAMAKVTGKEPDACRMAISRYLQALAEL